MKHSYDLSLFERSAHNPSYGALKRSAHNQRRALIDFCVPVNPYFPTADMLADYRNDFEEIFKYYPEQNEPIASVLGDVMGLDPNCLTMANGSTELITWIDHLFVQESIATDIPTFGRWTDQPMETHKRLICYERQERDGFQLDLDAFAQLVREQDARVVALCNPNNPSGHLLSRKELLEFIDGLPDLDLIIIDESFIDFSDPFHIPSVAEDAMTRENLVVVKSLGKNFGLHGVRFGYAVANPILTRNLRSALPKWNVNALAERVIRDLPQAWEDYETSRRQVIRDREYLREQLMTVEELKVYPSAANFVFIQCSESIDGIQLRNELIDRHGYFVRECSNKIGSSGQFIRIAANPRDKTDLLVEAIRNVVKEIKTKSAVA